MTGAVDFRKNAEMCREMAKAATAPDTQANWLSLAHHWEQLAREAERFPEAFPGSNGS
jgi:hypothetical protein